MAKGNKQQRKNTYSSMLKKEDTVFNKTSESESYNSKGESTNSENIITNEDMNLGTSEVMNFRSYDIRLTLPMTKRHAILLDNIELKIKTTRNNRMRITKNTIIRTLLDILDQKQTGINWKNITDENDLRERISNGFS